MVKLRISITLVFVLSFIFQAHAWWNEGHWLVAQIAYNNLNDYTKLNVNKIVSQFSQFTPLTTDFPSSAIWADDLKDASFFGFSAWHYINKPFTPTGFNAPPAPEINLQWALQETFKTLNSSKADTWSQATALRLFVHFMGDTHQPLHTITYFDEYFPKGDMGGNLFSIIVGEKVWKLHSFWDSGADRYSHDYPRPANDITKMTVLNTAIDITTKYPVSYFEKSRIQSNNFTMFIKESYNLGVQYGYLNGTLKNNQTVPDSYATNAADICTQQIALGGYRLAYLLDTIFRPNGLSAVPLPPPKADESDLFVLGGVAAGVAVLGVLVGSFVTSCYMTHHQKKKKKQQKENFNQDITYDSDTEPLVNDDM
eukprot:TRINITY_DN8812_c0_g1_i1.p1 TRINITY_DN8812_c0_g1~~TRINITY_DN8812_c0_g1_i1.p1  ORF type:complete len:368 (-),score=61.40 TRINITY_DN8812_c0_g1_i1:31-1134(-)